MKNSTNWLIVSVSWLEIQTTECVLKNIEKFFIENNKCDWCFNSTTELSDKHNVL